MPLYDRPLTPEEYNLLTAAQQLFYEKAIRDRRRGIKVGITVYPVSGHLQQIDYIDSDKDWHRDPIEGPAVISWHNNQQMEQKKYYVRGHLHRDPNQGPALQSWFDNGQKQEYIYCENNKLSLFYILGPAERTWNKDGSKATEMYLWKGKFHRDPRQGPSWNFWDDETGEITETYHWKGHEVESSFIPPHARPKPDGLGRLFV